MTTANHSRRRPLTTTSTLEARRRYHRRRQLSSSHRSRVPANPPPRPNPHTTRYEEDAYSNDAPGKGHCGPTSLDIEHECIFRGRPARGSDVAARSEFMGNHYHGEEDEYGQLVNIYSRATVVVWPRRHRLMWMLQAPAVRKRLPQVGRALVVVCAAVRTPLTRHFPCR